MERYPLKTLAIVLAASGVFIGANIYAKGADSLTGRQASVIKSDDRQFVARAARSDVAQISVAQLAASRSGNQAVKEYAQRIIADHTRAASDLKVLAENKRLTAPNETDRLQAKEIAKLGNLSGAAFDREFVKTQTKEHTDAIAMFSKESDRGSDHALRRYASESLPALQEHLRMLREISNADS